MENKNLYILPSFFEKITNEKVDNSLDHKSEAYKYDQYTLIKEKHKGNLSEEFKRIRYIPLPYGILDFESDLWDFTQYELTNKSHYNLHFEEVASDYRDVLKSYILLLVLKGNIKVSSLRSKFLIMRKFLNHINSRGVKKINNINEEDIKTFFDTLTIQKVSIMRYQHDVKEFLFYYDSEYKTNILTPSIQKECERISFEEIRGITKNNKREAIPDEYFNKLIQIFIQIMENPDEPLMSRAYAAALLIDSQTGIRVGELSLLEVGCVENVTIDGEEYRMLHYKAVKPARGYRSFNEEITYMNDLAYKGYLFLMKELEETRKKKNSNLLFCSPTGKSPTNVNYFVDRLKMICFNHIYELDSLNDKYKNVLFGETNLNKYIEHRGRKLNKETREKIIKADFGDDKKFYYPIAHQFRNTVVDRLLRTGVQMEYIRRYMGHLSQDTTDRYSSYKDTDLQENINFSEETLRTYLSGEAKILGNSSEQLMERINEWIIEQDLNIEKDLDTIIGKLLKIVPIRAKHGGMCIKGSKLTNACSVDAMTDEFYCACGICPNVCHFFFHADVSYSDFIATRDIYEYNLKNGFTRQAEKEKKKIAFILNNRLIPELKELNNILKSRSKESIIESHPNIEYVVKHLPVIEKEIELWI